MDVTSVAVRVDSRQIRSAKNELRGMQVEGQKAEKTMAGLGRSIVSVVGGLSAGMAVQQVIRYADAWQNASNQLRQVTNSASELSQVQSQLLNLSNETRSGFESTANLYSRLARSTTELGLSQTELLNLTKTINQAFVASGATAQEADAAITQLSQGLAAGALRGDEFNSVAEQAPMLMRAIADSLNLTIGELRDFASEGGITAEIVVNALRQASGEIEDNFSRAVLTFGQSMTVARNNLMQFIGDSEGITSTVEVLGRGLILLSENIEIATKSIVTLGVAMALPSITGFAGRITAGAGAMFTLEKATIAATAAARTLGRVVVAGAIVEGIVLAYEKFQEFSNFVEQTPATWGAAGRLAADQFANSLINGIAAVGNAAFDIAALVTDPIIQAFVSAFQSLPDLIAGNIDLETVWINASLNAELAFDRAFQRIGDNIEAIMGQRFIKIASDADLELWQKWQQSASLNLDSEGISVANDNMEKLNGLTKEQLKIMEELEKAAEREFEGWQQLDEFIASLERETAQVGMLAVEVEKLEAVRRAENIAKRAGISLSDEMRDKIEEEVQARHALEEQHEQQQRQLQELEAVGQRAFDGMADAIADFATTGKMSFADLTNSIIKDMIRISVQQAALAATGGSSGGGIFGSLFSGIMGMFGGSGVSASSGYGQYSASMSGTGLTNLSGMANGGNPQPGSITEVNERGPELMTMGNRSFLMMGNQSGTVTPNHMLPSGGSNVNIQIVNNGTPQEVTNQQKTQNSDGSIDIRMIVDDVNSRNTADRASKTNAAIRNTFGAKDRLTPR